MMDRTARTRTTGRTSGQVNGQDVKAGHGQDRQGRTWAERTGMVHGQDGRVIKRAGHKKLDANSSGLSPGLGRPDDEWLSTV